MSKKFPIYVPIDELTDFQNIVELVTEGEHTYARDRARTINLRVPAGTLYKINQILLQNSVCDVGYIREHKLWYVLLGNKILWSNFKVTTNKPKKVKEKPKTKFNRYTALTKGGGQI